MKKPGIFFWYTGFMTLIDSYNRTIDYLRISATDRCNFRCIYCMPEEGAEIAPRENLLSAEEIVRLARIASELGITKIRITGGEPLVRRDLLAIVRDIGKLTGIQDISITTNGSLLAPLASQLADAGVKRINISLDTLREERFKLLARRGILNDVLDGIESAFCADLNPIKINCVVLRGYNDDEAPDFARLTIDRAVHVRFIELMPIQWSLGDDSPSDAMEAFYSSGSSSPDHRGLFAASDLLSFQRYVKPAEHSKTTTMLDGARMRRAFVPSHETRSRIEESISPLLPAHVLTNGPAHTFRLQDSAGTIGFISQLSSDLCEKCNRLRLTADGKLRPCLMADGEIDVRSPLRDGASDEQLADLFRTAVLHKPKEHRLEDGFSPNSRAMSQIGG